MTPHNEEKNPKTCHNSIDVGGVYICKLECLPCQRIKECALSKIQKLELFFAKEG